MSSFHRVLIGVYGLASGSGSDLVHQENIDIFLSVCRNGEQFARSVELPSLKNSLKEPLQT
jgi:hypothetical protein